MTYEEALEKYVRVKFNLKDSDIVDDANIDSYTYDAHGCPTCGPSFVTEITLSARVNKKYVSKEIGDRYLSFSDILKEILEVQ